MTTLYITKATKLDLPEHATSGFKIQSDGDTLLFFHWHDTPTEERRLYPVGAVNLDVYNGLSESERENMIAIGNGADPDAASTVTWVSYTDVLAILPDRLAAVGLEDETDSIMGEVVGMFGVG